ncbi:ATP-binding protein [Amycolatopsis lurida]
MDDDLSGSPVSWSAEQVELRVPAEMRSLWFLRALADVVARRRGYVREALHDLRVAVNEAATWLIVHAAPGSELSCRYRLGEADVTVSVSVPTRAKAPPASDALAWQLMAALTDSLSYRPGDTDDTGRETTTITLAVSASTAVRR